jgi:hypothetical protein
MTPIKQQLQINAREYRAMKKDNPEKLGTYGHIARRSCGLTVQQRVPLVEQEIPILPGILGCFVGFVLFNLEFPVKYRLSFCLFVFVHCIVCPNIFLCSYNVLPLTSCYVTSLCLYATS